MRVERHHHQHFEQLTSNSSSKWFRSAVIVLQTESCVVSVARVAGGREVGPLVDLHGSQVAFQVVGPLVQPSADLTSIVTQLFQ